MSAFPDDIWLVKQLSGDGFVLVTDRAEVEDWLDMDPEIWQYVPFRKHEELKRAVREYTHQLNPQVEAGDERAVSPERREHWRVELGRLLGD